jgi:dihydrofolate reductase
LNQPLALVVAVSDNGVIGSGGGIPWHLPEDLKHFKRVTMGHAILMGRKTHESIGRPLPGRRNIVVSRNPHFVAPGCEVAPDLSTALDLARAGGDSEPRVIGGGELYRLALPLATRVHLSRVHMEVSGDTTFPELSVGWRTVSSVPSEDGKVTFLELERLPS